MSHIWALRTVWHHHQTDKFNWLSHRPRETMFQRECKAICWVMQQDNNPKNRSESESFGEVQSQSWCFGMSSRECFTPDISRILLKLNSFIKMVQNSSWPLQLRHTFGGGYWCQRGFNQLLNPFHAALWMFTVCAIKTHTHKKNITGWVLFSLILYVDLYVVWPLTNIWQCKHANVLLKYYLNVILGYSKQCTQTKDSRKQSLIQ